MPANKNIWRYLRLAIGLILILALIPTLITPDFWTTLAKVNIPLVILALILSIASVMSKAWRWGVVMRYRGIKLSPGYLLFSYFIGMFFNNFLPSGMGGDVVRAYEAARDTGKGAESVTSVIIERGSGMLAVFATGSIFALTVPALPIGVALLAHALFIGSLVAIWALWLDLTGRILAAIGKRLPARFSGLWAKITRVYEEFRTYRHQYRLLAEVTWQSIVTLILTLASVYTLLLAFNTPVPFAAFAAVFSILTAIDVVPISLNGLGVREGSYVFFLGLIGVEPHIALGVALMVRLLVLIQAAMGGIAYLWRNIRSERQPHVNPVNQEPS
jgi:glycosyltransferase 2 family protein